MAQLNVLAARFFRYRLPGSWVPGYLQARGFGPAIQDRWQAGYAPAGWNALTRHLRAMGWADEVIEQAGLARRSRRGNLFDVFRDRAMFPVTAPDGTIAGFIGRASDHAPAGVPKYLNSPRTCLYNKSALLFGLWEAREPLAAGATPGPRRRPTRCHRRHRRRAGAIRRRGAVRHRPHRPPPRRTRRPRRPAFRRGAGRLRQ